MAPGPSDATHDDTTTAPAADRARLLCVLRRASDPRWSFAYRSTRIRAASEPPRAWTCMRVVTVGDPAGDLPADPRE